MNLPGILLVVGSLSLGVLEIAFSTGATIRRIKFSQALKMALFMVAMHIPILLLGWYSGEKLDVLITRYEHWIALGILVLLGIKMIVESLLKNAKRKNKFSSVTLAMLLGMILTALFDALILGVTFALLNLNIILISIITSGILFLATLTGIFGGKVMVRKLSCSIKAIGGALLVVTGTIVFFHYPF